MDFLPQWDVFLVFGGFFSPSQQGFPFPDISAQSNPVWYTAISYHAGKFHKLILSSRRNDWNTDFPSQDKTIGRFFIALGVPIDAVILEEQIRNTFENAIYCKELMFLSGINHAILVTSPLHMSQSLSVLRSRGVDEVPSTIDFIEVERRRTLFLSQMPSIGALLNSTYTIHDWIGMDTYHWRGWI